jgi:hypothetical protein
MLDVACLDNLFNPHDEYDIGIGRVSTLGIIDPTILESAQSYNFLIKVGLQRS